ncbi:Non-ribosomal peptide synthetase [Alloactinosynnema sp. L-07]|uniref:non-ribosomal peptide synthetase n=1 Tax=Alloactinosynnema sp. L-07 TaxID=1653480 RepID=UPI00065F0A4A|nr:non-ribosomal peptide synthetase [Alloactinosynnema sp. L-07]CRK56747.1 Non-ribosomal peptide synthetase [Alloactinosynnema sp. L-07]
MSDWRSATITELFDEQVRCRPDKTAVRFLDEDMTYAQLDQAADNLARHLRTLGVDTEGIVGVCVERSFEMIVALLGILKAGAAYLPLHPDEPAERFRYMLDQADARVLLTHERLAGRLPDVDATVLSLDGGELPAADDSGPLDPGTSADSLAYVCYTSGSTGKPKGVTVPHRGVVRLIQDGDYAELGPDETIMQLCALTFDPATFEIWGALLNGGTLVVYQPGPLSLSELGDSLQREKVTTLWLTTGLFHRMVDGQLDGIGGLRQLLAGGDVLSPTHINSVRRTHPDIRLVNGYGPTENTCFTTCHTVTDLVEDTVPIGRAITDTLVYILDEDLVPVPDGEWGDLYTAGAGLARGYLGRPRLTAERFVPDPFRSGERMYSIGDVVRRGVDGALEFRGRRDDQVKVGGYRVELGEIVAAVAGQPGVKEAVVVVRHAESTGEKSLVAYVVPEDGADDLLAKLRLALHQRLPRHMIPSAIVFMAEFPLTRNGKVDRAALPAPDQSPRDVDTDYVPPRTPVEALLADLWSDALAVKDVGVHDDFFELGGNSLLAADLLVQMRGALSAEMPGSRLFFENATVAGLAELVDKGGSQAGEGLPEREGPAA